MKIKYKIYINNTQILNKLRYRLKLLYSLNRILFNATCELSQLYSFNASSIIFLTRCKLLNDYKSKTSDRLNHSI